MLLDKKHASARGWWKQSTDQLALLGLIIIWCCFILFFNGNRSCSSSLTKEELCLLHLHPKFLGQELLPNQPGKLNTSWCCCLEIYHPITFSLNTVRLSFRQHSSAFFYQHLCLSHLLSTQCSTALLQTKLQSALCFPCPSVGMEPSLCSVDEAVQLSDGTHNVRGWICQQGCTSGPAAPATLA